MATIKGGRRICDKCGDDCTSLYGFSMIEDKRMMHDQRVKDAFAKIDKEFGQHEVVFCWSCTMKAFGMLTIKQKAMAKAREAKTKE